MVVGLRKDIEILLWIAVLQMRVVVDQRDRRIVARHLFYQLSNNAQISSIWHSPNNHLHLSLQEHPAKSGDGFGLAASGGAFDEGQSIFCAFRQRLVLFLIKICLPGEVHLPLWFHFVCDSFEVVDDVRALVKFLALVLILVEWVNALIGAKGGVRFSQVETYAVFDSSPAEKNIKAYHQLPLLPVSGKIEVISFQLQHCRTLIIAEL